jgi:dTDP-4-dehydrorhamnose reductase
MAMSTNPNPLRVLLIGSTGQVGHAWKSLLSAEELVAAPAREELDLSQPEFVAARVQEMIESCQPTLIVNAAAYTAVDQAEQEQTLAFDINARAPGALAKAAANLDVPLIHYSTDYVFDGQGQRPYVETDPVAPLSVYGHSKLAGEQAVQAAGGAHLIFRTSWVFSAHGQNFLKTMLSLAQTRDQLRVVQDQVGAPTSAHLLAHLPLQLFQQLKGRDDPRWGLYHLCPTGQTSWHEYARYVIERARALGWPIRVKDDAIHGISSDEFPVKATRPSNSRLCTVKFEQATGIGLAHWRDGVDEVLDDLSRAA